MVDRFNYPSTTVSRRVKGDSNYANNYRGDADKLLYELRNLMKFRKLGQLKMTRLFSDGTVITAKSSFGLDIVEIDVTQSTFAEGECNCSITLYDVPEIVQPMRYPGIVGTGVVCQDDPFGLYYGRVIPAEEEGKDYIKTYYTLNLNCLNTLGLDWNVCEPAEFDIGLSPNWDCDPFTYEDETGLIPYYQGEPGVVTPAIPEPDNHCIYSNYGRCNAEIIETGSDENGTYIIWKAHTEWSMASFAFIHFSRSGLGYVKLKPFVKTPDGEELCFAEEIVKVDCCEKDAADRTINMYNDDWCLGPDCGFMFFEDGKYYQTPEIIPNFWQLIYYCYWSTGAFFIFPELSGACKPYTWTLSGPGSIGEIGEHEDTGLSTTYILDDNWQDVCFDQDITLTVTDRCGTEDSFVIANCCRAYPGGMEIIYDALNMYCYGQQILYATGGCYPYTWDITGGGGALSEPSGAGNEYVTFTAPESNANCAANPTIRATDCCGNEATVKIAVNCYNPPVDALKYCGHALTGPCTCTHCAAGSGCDQVSYDVAYDYVSYDCNGDAYNTCSVSGEVTAPGPSWEGTNCIPWPLCAPGEMPKECINDICSAYINGTTDCNMLPTCGSCYGIPCNTLSDERTAEQKAAGCCPINPYTGLPYD